MGTDGLEHGLKQFQLNFNGLVYRKHFIKGFSIDVINAENS